MGLVKLYLILYNCVLAYGWSTILLSVARRLTCCEHGGGVDLAPAFFPEVTKNHVCVTGDSQDVFNGLVYFQTAAILEIFHAMFKFVPSSVGTTFQQVFSRIMLTWGICYMLPAVMELPAFTAMTIAWSVTEVVRYSWYALKDALGKAPYVLTWCRYTFFIVLYPMGVYGELCLNMAAADGMAARAAELDGDALEAKLCTMYYYVIMSLSLLYIPGFPPLYLYMFGQRKKQLGRPKRAAPAPDGIQFPITDAKKGERSTTVAGQAAFAMSLANVDFAAASAAIKERNWRFGYTKHVIKNVEVSCRSTEVCVQVARAGLDYIYKNFEFYRNGQVMNMHEAMSSIKTSFPGTYKVSGKGTAAGGNLSIPLRRGVYPVISEVEQLTGAALQTQLDAWASAGTIEPSARDAISAVAKNPAWLDLSGKTFVLLGAGAAMGPYEMLLKHGANIIALDLDREGIWSRLIKMAANSPGTITFPIKTEAKNVASDAEAAKVAGCNLFTQAPEICNWIVEQCPTQELIIGGYAYLDGELHVRVSLAMDAIMEGVIDRRPKGKTTLAYLCSPTDIFVCDKEARAAAETAYKRSSALSAFIGILRMFSKKICVRNTLPLAKADDGKEFAIVDGIVPPQGPNYALAKRIQHWRAMLSRANGVPVSSNIAPSTATISVVHNKQFAAAYGGFQYFTPMWVSFQETSNAVMFALLVHDVCNDKSATNPKTKLDNPVQLFAPGSFHGGIWRQAYKIGSIGEVAALLNYFREYRVHMFGAVTAAVGAVAYSMQQQQQ